MLKATGIAFDALTLYCSGGTAIATKICWAKRIWAMAEVAGALGNIAANTGVVKEGTRLYSVVQIYNGVMGLIGVKNLIAATPSALQNLADFATNLSSDAKSLIQTNGSVRALILTKYNTYKDAIKSLGQLTDDEEKIISTQENVWEALVNEAVEAEGEFNLADFKNATVKTPGIDNNSLTNLPKSFFKDAYKVTPQDGSSLKAELDNIIANGDEDGSLTEKLIDDVFANNGYQQGNGKYFGDNGNNGIDRFYYKGDISNPTEIIVFEGKQMSADGSASLNAASTTTNLPVQMSDNWLQYIAREKLNNLTGLQKQTGQAILNAPIGSIQKYVVVVDKTNGQINFLKLGSF